MAILRITERKKGLAEYLRTGKRKGELPRDERDYVIPLYGDLDLAEQTEKYVFNNKNWKSSYLHLTFSFTKEEFEKGFLDTEENIDEAKLQDIVREIIEFFVYGYDLENEVIAYSELHYPKIRKEIDKKGELKEKLPHIHIELSKLNPLLDNQIHIQKMNFYLTILLQTYINKKYNLDLTSFHFREENKNEKAKKIIKEIADMDLEELERRINEIKEKHSEYVKKRRSKKARKILRDLKKKEKENKINLEKEIEKEKEKINVEDIKNKYNLLLNITNDNRVKNYVDYKFDEAVEKNFEKLSKETINEIKQNLNAELVLDYAVEKFKINRNDYEIIGNKIKKKNSKRKPKSIIDFLIKDIKVKTKEAFQIVYKLYQQQQEQEKSKDKDNEVIKIKIPNKYSIDEEQKAIKEDREPDNNENVKINIHKNSKNKGFYRKR